MEKERKLQIIRAADKRFSRHGLGKTTLDEIARDLRIGKATIYHYFTSKEELFFETIQWEISQIIEDVKSIFNNEQRQGKERFDDYLTFKEDLINKYKLVYEIILLLLKDEIFEREAGMIGELFRKEEEVVSHAINELHTGENENINSGLPMLYVMQSWGMLLGTKLLQATGNINNNFSRELLHRSLNNML